jgi:hypothetical protein
VTLSRTLASRDAALRSHARALAVAASPGVRRIALSGGHGTLVVDPAGRAALLLSRLPQPGPGKVYEAWVISAGTTSPAGLFSTTEHATAVPLEHTLPPGATVAVTIEKAGGAPQPTHTPILHSDATT